MVRLRFLILEKGREVSLHLESYDVNLRNAMVDFFANGSSVFVKGGRQWQHHSRQRHDYVLEFGLRTYAIDDNGIIVYSFLYVIKL